MRTRIIFCLIICSLIVSVSYKAPTISSHSKSNLEFIKDWEIDLTKEGENALSYLQPIKILKNPNKNELFLNCIGNLLRIDAENGEIKTRYTPPNNFIIFDFILSDSFLFISLTSKNGDSNLMPCLVKFDYIREKIIWETTLCFGYYGCYFTLYSLDGTLMVFSSYKYYLLNAETGKIIESFTYSRHIDNPFSVYPSIAIKERTLYFFSNKWKNVFVFDLPDLILKNIIHIEFRDNIHLVEVINSSTFLFLSDNQLLIVDENGKITKDMEIKREYIILPLKQVTNEPNVYINPAVYKNYVFSLDWKNNFICLADITHNKIYQTEREVKYHYGFLPYFWEDKLFMLENLNLNESRITVSSVPDLSVELSITEKTYNIRGITIRESLFPIFSPSMLTLKEEGYHKLVVIFRSKICQYKIFLD